MVSESVRRLGRFIVMILLLRNSLQAGSAAIDASYASHQFLSPYDGFRTQQQRLQPQKRVIVALNHHQMACHIGNAVLLLHSTFLYIASLSKKQRDRLLGPQAGLLLYAG